MIDPRDLESYGYGAEKIFANLEIRIMLDVARRIHDANVITRSADWQLYQLKLMGYSNADIRKLVESALGDSEAYVNSLYEEAIKTDYIRYKPMYEYMNKDFVPWIANTQLRNIVEQKRRNTINDYTNMTRSLGFVINDGTGLKAVRLTDYVNDKLNQCYVDIATGAFDYNTTLRKAVTEMTNSGVRWINYDTGWHNRITVAARRSIMSSLSDINSSISDQVAKDLNTDMFEVTAHANARPTHAVWQGGWYTKRELEEVCGLGDVTGLLGANCYHNYYPVIPGLSRHTYTKRELEEWKSDTPKEYEGKAYTGYEATQRMRKMETNMRAYRERIKILKESGGSEVDILATQARYRTQMNEYAKFSDAMGLKQQKERIYADGLGKMGTCKKILFGGARITDPDSKEAMEHAKKYYGLVNSMKTDVKRIAKNTGYRTQDIQKIKDYVFKNHSGVSDNDFFYDATIAQSWQRLIEGNNIQKHDVTLLEHEYYELTMKQIYPGIDHLSAHVASEKLYNYSKESREFYGSLEKHKAKK